MSLYGVPARAAIIYWDNTDGTANDWGSVANWSTVLGGGTNPVAIPGAADIATFSATPIQGTAQTVNLNGARSVLGLDILAANIATTTLLGGGTNQTLTLGTSGIAIASGAGAVTIGSATTGQQVAVTLGGAQSWTNNSANLLTVTNGVTNGGNLLTVTGSGNTSILGIVAGTGGVTKSGAGTLTLSGVNTYTGTTALSAGTLRATTSAQALGTGVATLSLGGGTLELANDTGLSFSRNTTVTANAAITADRLTSAATTTTHTLGTLSIGAQTLTINRGANITGTATGGVTFGAATLTGAATFSPQANALLTFSSTTGLGANLFTKSGAGSMTLTGVVSGSTAAGTTSMSIGNGMLTASGANTFTGNIAVSGSGVFAMAGNTYTTTAPYGTVTGGTAYKQLLLSSGGTFRLNSGTFNNNAPTTTNIAAGIIFNIGTGGATFDVASGASLVIDDGTGTGTATTASQLQGTGTITKTGLGIFQQDDSTAFAGAMIIASGSFQPASANAGGATSAGTTIQSGAQYNVNGVTMTNQEPLTINGTGLASAPAGALTNASGTAATWVGPITLGSAATIGSSGAGGLTLGSTATVATAGNPLTIAISGGGRIFIDGVISGTGSVAINATSTGDYVPRADHTYSGGTTLTAGPVAVDRDSTGPAGAPTAGAFGTGTLTIAGGQLRAGTSANRTVGNTVTLSGDTGFFTVASEKSLTFSGPVTLSGGNRTLTANAGTTVAGVATIFSGAIGDAGGGLGLTKAGTGNLILGGANTYTGTTGATGGILLVTGSLANNGGLSLVPAAAGGTVFSFVNNTANTPANFGSLTLGSAAGTSFLGLDLGTSSDTIATSAAATAGNSIRFNLNAAAGFAAGTYNLVSAASGLTAGGATYGLGTVPGGYTYSFTTTDSLVQLTATATGGASRYWRGNLNTSWAAFSDTTTTNWATDAAGTTVSASTPGAADTVVFSALNATGPTITTTVDNAFTFNDLQFLSAPSGVSAVTINPGLNAGSASLGTLTIAPTSATAGLAVAQGAGAVTIAAPITLGAAQTWSVDGSTPASGTASSLTVSGAISGSAANGITFTSTAGTAPIILSGVNSYAGGSTVSTNTIVQGGVANGFSPNTGWTVGGTLNTGAFSHTTGSLAGGTGFVQNGSATNATLTIGGDNLASATFAGTIQNGSTGTLGLTKAGTGLQVLSGTSTYTGTTTVTAGTLRIGAAAAYPATSALVVNGTGTFDLFGNSLTAASLAGGATTGVITNTSASTNASTATTPGTPSGTGIYVDSLTGTAAGNHPTATVTDGATRKTQIIMNNANSSTAFAGLTAATANTYSGGLVLAHNATTGTRLVINATPTGTPFGTGPIIVGQAATDRAGIYFSGAATFASPIVINTALGSDRVGIRADAAVTLSGVITANLAPATFTSNSATAGAFTLTNQVTGPAGLVLDITSLSAAATAFTVTLNNATANPTNYQGDTVVNLNAATGKSATLALGAANQIPNGTGAGNVILNTSGTGVGLLNLNGFSDIMNGLSGNGTVDGTSGTPTLTVGGNDATATFSGIIRNTAGSLTLAKIGGGTQTLSGTSTFAGPLTVDGGLIAFASSPATSGPLGNSASINLNGGGISYTASGVNALNRSLAIGVGNGTIDVGSAAGTLTLLGADVTSAGGNLIKTGPGIAAITGTTTLAAGAAGVVVNAGTLQAGFGTAGIGSIVVGGSGELSFRNNAAEPLTLGSSGTVLTLSNGARLSFELDGVSSDSITVPTGGGLSLGGGYTFDFSNAGSGITANTYTLLTAPAGSALNTFSYTLGAAPLGYNYSFLTSDTQVLLQTVAYTPTYWSGATDGSWATAANFATDAAGTTPAAQPPVATETVIFNATSAVGPTVATTLDGSLTVDSLQFNGLGTPATSLATIAQGTGGTLTLKPASASGGIALLTGGGSATISAPLTLDNTLSASQAWNIVDAGSTLTLSGNVVFGANVNKAGAGTVILAGSNSGAGNFSLNAGGLHLNAAAALGTGSLSIAAGTTLDNTSGGAVALTGNGPVNINGDFTFTGSNSLGLGTGAVALGGNPTITVAGGTLTLGGAASGSTSLTKTGGGALTLSGNNSFTGPLTLAAGGLNLGHAGALGTGSFVVNAGTIDNTSGASLVNANNNPLTVNGSFTFTGTNDLNLGSGTIGLMTTPTITVAAKALTLAGNITGGLFGVTKSGAGTLTLAGTNVYTGSTIVNGGTLTITGSITGNTTTSRLDYGTTAGTTVVNHSGNLTAWVTRGADVAGAVSVFNQTAGTVAIVPTAGQDQQYLANNGGYGMLNITGGTFTTGRFSGTGNTNGNASTAVIYVGGTGSLTQNVGDWFLPIRNSGMMSMTIAPGGTFTRATAVGNQFSITGLSMSSTNNYSYGLLNVAGGTVDTGTRGINFSQGTFASGTFTSTGFVNVSGGTLLLGTNPGIGNAAGTTTGYFNFAGGTLKATAALTAVVPANTANYLFTTTVFGPITNNNSGNTAFNAQVGTSSNFTGGLIVDTNSFSVSFTNALTGADNTLAVTQPDITIPASGNSGYSGAPMVQFAAPAGGGVPASGYALISSGQVTGIVITNPGTYASGETPLITLTGGGGSIAPFNTTPLATANASAGLTKNGAGTLVLSGANTFTGATVVSSGTLQLGGAGTTGSLAPASAITTNGTLAFNRTNTVTQGTDFAATIGGSGGLAQTGSGTLVLNGVNTYTGPTTLTAGSLSIAASSNLGGSASSLVFDGGTLQITGTTLASLSGLGRTVSFVSGKAVGFDINAAGHTFTADQALTQGTGGLTKSGAGTLVLNQTNTYTGATNINAGTLVISGSTNTGAATITLSSGGTLAINTGGSLTTTGTLALGAVSTGNVFTVQNGAAVNVGSIINPWGTSYTIDGTLTSTGTWNVSTNRSTDTFTGSGTISAAALTLGNASTGVNYTGSGTITLSGALTVASNSGTGAAFYTQTSGLLNTGSILLGDSIANTTGSRTFNLNGGRVNVGAGGIASTGTTTATRAVNLGAGTLGATADWSSSLAMTLASATPGVTINTLDAVDGTTGRTITLSGVLSGTGAVTKTGAGTAILSGVNTFTGDTRVAGGTLTLSAAAGNTSLALAGSTFDGGAGGAVSFGTMTAATFGGLKGSGGLVLENATAAAVALTVGSNNASTTYIGGLSGSGSLVKTGAGTLSLTGANTYAGPTSVNTGTLAFATPTALYGGAQASWTSTNVTVASAATLAAAMGGAGQFTSADVAALVTGVDAGFASGSSLGVDVAGGNTATLSANLANTNVGANSLGFVKLGGGSLTLSGTNTYTGDTVVTAGTLTLSGALTGNGTTTAGSTLRFGPNAGVSVFSLSGNVSSYYTFLGAQASGAVAVYNQTGGTASYTSTNTGNTTALVSNAAGGFGAMNITGGTTSVLGRFILNRTGTAVGYVGGSGVLNLKGEWGMIVYGTANTSGSLTIGPGGLVDRSGATQRFGIFMEQAGQYGVMNLAGGSFVTTTQPIVFGNGNGGTNNIGFVNLAQGTLQMGTNVIQSVGTSTGQVAYLNFAGGTLRASAALTAAFPTTVTGQTVVGTMFGPISNTAATGDASQNFAGGLAVDTNGFGVAIGTPLVDPTGVGVTQADIAIPTSGNSGYLAAPFVRFSAPAAAGSVPAAGYAVVSNGQVTGIVITAQGTYAANEQPTITLTGGGGSIAAFQTAPLATANTGGGLTKSGAGTLTLSGANTFSGITAINAGTLSIAATTNLPGWNANGRWSVASGAVLAVTNAVADADVATLLGTTNIASGGAFGFDTSAANRTYPTAIAGAAGIVKIGTNTLTLAADNTYAGSTTIAAGTLQIGAGGTTGTLGGGGVANAGTLIFNRSNAYTLATGNLVTGAGTVTLSGGVTLTAAADNQFTTTGAINFGLANAAANANNLDLTAGSGSFGAAFVRTNNAAANTVTVGAGKTFALTGLTMGYDAGGGTGATLSNLTVTGAGTMSITNPAATVTIGTNQAAQNAAYWNSATLDLAGLGGFSVDVGTFNVGVGTTTQGPGTLVLSNTANTIVATTLTAGDTVSNNGRGTGRIQLGAGTNIIRVDTFNIGRGKNSGPGVVEFLAKTAGSPGSVTITNKAATGPANITVGDNNGTNTGGGAVGTLDLRGHVASVTAGTLLAGRNNMGSTGTGSVTSDVFFDAGTFSVNTITMAQKTGAGTGGVTATLNVGGGSFTVNAGGSFTLGSQATAGTATATLNLTGGTFTSNVDILDGGGATASLLNLDGGTLDMTGRTIGTATNVINTLTLASGTLRNVGEINGGGAITKTTAGTLAMAGTSSYTGQTLVQAGTLTFDSIANVGGGASALGAPTTAGTGTIALGAAATGATLQYLGGTAASTDRVLNLAGTTGGATLDSSGADAIAFAASLTATGAGSKSLTLSGTNTGANTLAGIIPDNSPTNVTSLAKSGAGRWVLAGANAYTGGTTVSGGTLALSGSGSLGGGAVLVNGGMLDLGGLATANVINFQSGGLANAAQATLTNVLGGSTLSTNGLTIGGTVNVTGTLDGTGLVGLITGSGLIGPGNSPGILTASQLDFSGGIDQAFEFTAADVDPTWSTATSSVNDVLRLTNAAPFNGTTATGSNAFDIYFNVAALTGTETFSGGIFTDSTVDPWPSVTNATFNYFVKGDGGGTITYKGANYYTLAQYNAANSTAWTVSPGTARVPSADFAGGTAENGFVQTFAVPEPGSVALLLVGVLALGGHRLSRKARRR